MPSKRARLALASAEAMHVVGRDHVVQAGAGSTALHDRSPALDAARAPRRRRRARRRRCPRRISSLTTPTRTPSSVGAPEAAAIGRSVGGGGVHRVEAAMAATAAAPQSRTVRAKRPRSGPARRRRRSARSGTPRRRWASARHPAERRRLADGAAGVRAEGEGHQARGHRRGRAAAGAAGHALQVPGVAGRPGRRSSRWRSPWRTRPCWSCRPPPRPRARGARPQVAV